MRKIWPTRAWIVFPFVSMTLIGVPVLVVVAPTDVAPPVVVVCKKSGAPRFAEKFPPRCASVGTLEIATRPMSWRMPWKSPKKKVRSLMIGPPAANPYWLRRKTGFFGLAAVAGAKRFLAFSASLRRNSNAVPCNPFEPDLVVSSDVSVEASELRGRRIDLDLELLDGVDHRVEGELPRLGLERRNAVVEVFIDARSAAVDARKRR